MVFVCLHAACVARACVRTVAYCVCDLCVYVYAHTRTHTSDRFTDTRAQTSFFNDLLKQRKPKALGSLT